MEAAGQIDVPGTWDVAAHQGRLDMHLHRDSMEAGRCLQANINKVHSSAVESENHSNECGAGALALAQICAHREACRRRPGALPIPYARLPAGEDATVLRVNL